MAPRDSLADSDGYYCAADGYLAYEFSFSKYRSSEHVLTIVFFDDVPGRIEPVDVPLDAFQVHGMRCTADAVELLAFTALYRIDLIDRRSLNAKKIRDFGGQMDTDSGIDTDHYRNFGNLIAWNIATTGESLPGPEVDVISLSRINGTFAYSLHMTAYGESHAADGGSIHNIYTHSKIVKKAGARIEDILDIHSGFSMHSVD
jgi:hypothetical protein